ncbi:leucine-rich repeat protein [Plasmodium sp. gorilla clade G2]|uniref:leucine-rich repeat protein n=1 Tax=Plasmodium sp. gorilla clade G2 TaxID=880535 RepID=UPI000D21C36E|nr:leucine-rich repeat protein [Plasmodium sp. gorilla clade G2]SOV14475.1 leucine-rich repeat protein [Plasmodium sp. gorilla clade G2]
MSNEKGDIKEDNEEKLNVESVQNDKKENTLFDDIIPQHDYKRIRTNIINEEILIEGINKSYNLKREDIIKDFYYAKVLSLENRDIVLIQNMNLFKNLEELHLNNNLIEDLENLEELINLKILSASNNKIKKIKNLNNLYNLRELNLHNNEIERIENLNNNKKLQILILSNNYIKHIEDIIYLKCLDKLKFLNIINNPICNIPDLQNFVMKNLISIKYFNNIILSSIKKVDTKHIYIHPNEDLTIYKSSIIKEKGISKNENSNPYFYIKNNCSDIENYKKNISEAYLYELTTLPDTLFDEKKQPPIFKKIINYEKIKEIFLTDLREIHLGIIDKILLLNEDRKKCSYLFEEDVEKFISQYMLNNIEEYNKLKKRSKKVIHSLEVFLDHPKEFENMMMKKCPNYYKKNIEIKNKEQINNSVIKRFEEISKSLNLNIIKDDLLNLGEDKETETYITDEKTNICTNNNYIYVDKEKYNTIKIYIENNIKENIFFRDKLINDELMNIVALNNFIEIFKTNISKTIKRINDNITDYFKKLDKLEEKFNTQIINFFSEVKNNDHPSIVLSEDEINEYYSYKNYRSNIMNNLEDYISSSYNKAGSVLIEEKKKHLFLQSRDRIEEIGKIVNIYNDLFYSYLYIIRVE